MAFMEIETLHDVWYTVEMDNGESHLVPESVCGRLPIPDGHNTTDEDNTPPEDWELIKAWLRDFVGNDIREVSAERQWGARYSAPGYMDCTDWILADTEEEAVAECKELYGSDEDEEEETEEYDHGELPF